MREIFYNREKSVSYARQWAMKRNPKYGNFDGIGGDCTNFVSQCICAGCSVMNYTKDVGWFYNSMNSRAAAWTGVEYLYKFLVNNKGIGPYGKSIMADDALPGDVIQLGTSDGSFYHSLFVSEVHGSIKICAHTDDSLDRELSTYFYEKSRGIRILGARM